MLKIIGFLLLLITPALAHDQPSSASEQALSSKLLFEINAGLQCGAALITEQAETQRLRARIKELEDKHESK